MAPVLSSGATIRSCFRRSRRLHGTFRPSPDWPAISVKFSLIWGRSNQSVSLICGSRITVLVPCSTAKLIVPWKAGGGTHVLFSIFEKTIAAMDVKPKLKVVTIPGQGGNKGAKEASKAKPDGCTLFAIHQSAFTSHLNGRIKFHFDAFDPVALLTDTPDIIGASAKAPWNNYGDFQKAVKAAPGTASQFTSRTSICFSLSVLPPI